MSKTMLTVATRKGTFVLESDDRRDWDAARPVLRRMALLSRDLRPDDRRHLRGRGERVARL